MFENVASSTAPRGIAPRTLIEQVRNTAPFLFQGESVKPAYIRTIQEVAADPDRKLSHLEYFRLCVSAHWATVATFVPTDVDNQIRFRLWHPSLPTEILVAMAQWVLEARLWDVRPVSTRRVESVSGHNGEWLSIAVAAYAALRRRHPECASEIAEAIVSECQAEAGLFQRLRRLPQEHSALDVLRTSTLIAHNLGDLDRVIDMWSLREDDPLRTTVYKLGQMSERGARPDWHTELVRAGELNRKSMAAENHRHFPLRKPRGLRRSAEFLLPIGPFFDDWGAKIASDPTLSREEVAEVSLCLIEGWERLPDTVGYPRALAGVLEGFRGGLSELARYLPTKRARQLQSGPLRTLISVPRARFEAHWKAMVIRDVRSRETALSN